jgi:large subunit ribosomal protein L18
MDNSVTKSQENKRRRALRVRKHLRGNADKPRMCVVKTNKHIQVQIINDDLGTVLASISTLSNEMKNTPHTKKNKATAKVLGERIGQKAKALGIEQVIFDRGPFRFHGILAELADGARASGLQF